MNGVLVEPGERRQTIAQELHEVENVEGARHFEPNQVPV